MGHDATAAANYLASTHNDRSVTRRRQQPTDCAARKMRVGQTLEWKLCSIGWPHVPLVCSRMLTAHTGKVSDQGRPEQPRKFIIQTHCDPATRRQSVTACSIADEQQNQDERTYSFPRVR